MRKRIYAGILIALLGLLAACESKTDTDRATDTVPKAGDSVASVMVDSVNYRHDMGMDYTLYDRSGGEKKAVGGSIVNPLEGGGAKGCCLALPKDWHPEIKVLLEWSESDFVKIYPEKYVRELEIPRYEKPADLYVVFYPEHEVEVVVSSGEPGHPAWAGRIKQTPWDACVAEFGRKVCKRAIPMVGLSLEELQGYCTFVREEHVDQKSCTDAYDQCLRNYEDDELCKKTLWGARRK